MKNLQSHLLKLSAGLFLFWTVLMVFYVYRDIHTVKEETLALARHEAMVTFNKDQAIRAWSTKHGGVYVVVTEDTPPNVFLSHIPERDIRTPSGRELTLMNPAYMLRQVMEEYELLYGTRGRITSLKPLNPANKPDQWEREALESFERDGGTEALEIVMDGQAPYLRLMRPMVVRKGCLKCHGFQGYEEGDIRGGLSVRLPLQAYLAVEREVIRKLIVPHILFWILGVLTLGLFTFWTRKVLREQLMTEQVLSTSNRELLTTLATLKETKSNYKQSLAEFQAIFSSITDAIVFADQDRRIIMINPAFESTFGYSLQEIKGKTTQFFYANPEEYGQQGQKRYNNDIGNALPEYEISYKRRDGSIFPSATLGVPVVDQDGKPMGFLGVIRDISNRKVAEDEKSVLERQLRQAQKLEAVGTLAGGIAHDFNNILSAILGYTEIARESLPEGSATARDLEYVLEAGNRAKELVKQILAFSRQSQLEAIVLNPVPLVKEALKLLRSSLPTTIEIRENIYPDSGTILADPTHIHQIVMNLCTNAFHAMEKNGGTLKVTLAPVTIGEGEGYEGFDMGPGPYIKLMVEDNGSGIDAAIIDMIFDPFFTTKETDRGTGMGLAIIHGIVSEYGGGISVQSEMGRGTSFTLLFPRSDDVAEEQETVGLALPTGSEHILLVDDEALLVDLGKMILERLGYHVTVSHSGVEALKLFRKSPDSFDLVLTDQTMPRLTGTDMAREMLVLRPDLAIVLCSGYSSQVDEGGAKAVGIREFVMKPLTKETLSRVIRKALDGEQVVS